MITYNHMILTKLFFDVIAYNRFINLQPIRCWFLMACYGGHHEVLERLLAVGTDIHRQTNNGECQEGHSEVVETLLAAGANLHHQTMVRRNCFWHAKKVAW